MTQDDLRHRARLSRCYSLAAVGAAFAAAGTIAACFKESTPDVIEHTVRWELRSIDGPRLALRFQAGACAGEDFSARPRVEEGPRRVTIAVIARRPAVARCAGVVRMGRLQVTLRAPLRDRSLAHAPTSGGEQPGDPPGSAFRCPADAPARRLDARRFVGLTLSAARDLAGDFNCTVRATERDGRSLPHTQDLRRDRINVAVRDGRILRVSVG
jgi:hypothetical protein